MGRGELRCPRAAGNCLLSCAPVRVMWLRSQVNILCR